MPATTVAAVTAAQKKACRKDVKTILKIIVFAFNQQKLRTVWW